jgi:hypothetical protein
MKNAKLIKWGVAQALGVFIYILLLSVFMNKANDWLGQDDRGILAPIMALLILVFSALVTGGLVLAKPIMLYIDGRKKEGVRLLLGTGLSIFVLILLFFFILVMTK